MRTAMDRMPERLRSCLHFDRLLSHVAAADAYLVGGAIRDALTDRPIIDIDLVFPRDPTALARKFASLIGGHWFWLDDERRQSRVVVSHDSAGPSYDFALFRAPCLADDLLDRDFTINALALPLGGALSAACLVDPCQGLGDLQQGVLRMVGQAAFANDPLRIVKGIRHATVLDLEIESGTLRGMRAETAGLDRVARERIRQEVWKILVDERAVRGLQLLIDSGAGPQLFGDGFAGSYQVLAERLEHCLDQWGRLAAKQPLVNAWLARDIEQGLNGKTLLTFTLLLSAIDRDLPVRLSEEWKLSRTARANVAAVAALDGAGLHEFAALARTRRAFAWWAARRQCDPHLLLLALAGSPSTGAYAAAIPEWVPLVADLRRERPQHLVDGHWLRNELSIEPGPEINKTLELLRNAEMSGEVSSREDACRFLARLYQNRD